MIQFFTPENIRDENETKAYNVFKALVDPFKSYVNDYYTNAYSSPELGEILYTQRFSPITNIWNNEYVKKIYSYWHECYKNVQSAHDLLLFLNHLYQYSEINIDIVAPENVTFRVKVLEGEDMFWNRDSKYNLPLEGWEPDMEDPKDYELFVLDSDEDEDTTGIILKTIFIAITENGLYNIMKDVIYPGLFYNVSVNK